MPLARLLGVDHLSLPISSAGGAVGEQSVGIFPFGGEPPSPSTSPGDALLDLIKKGVYGASDLWQMDPPTPRPLPCIAFARLVSASPRRKVSAPGV